MDVFSTDFLQNVLTTMVSESDWSTKDLIHLVGPADMSLEKVKGGASAALIFNNQTSYGEGEHWVGVYIDGHSSTAHLFDSLPVEPFPQHVTSWLVKNPYLKMVYVNKELHLLQNPLLPFCGLYCLAWLNCCIRNETLTLSTCDLVQNDIHILKTVAPYVKMSVKKFSN
jgi:hypothetical protein